jgi:hypothetical protein
MGFLNNQGDLAAAGNGTTAIRWSPIAAAKETS